MIRRIGALALLSTGMLLGCEDKAAAPGAAPNAPAVELADSDLPSEVDFDDEADKSITGDNYAQELDALEKEIAADP